MSTSESGHVIDDNGKTLCIVGAGLSALIFLRELTQVTVSCVRKGSAPLAVIIVDEMDADQFGRGIAYASPWQPQFPENRGSRAELLNSPAVRMSLEAVIGAEGDFVDWLQQHPSRWQQLLGLTWCAQAQILEVSCDSDWPVWEVRALKRWLAFNQAKLSAVQYETVYFPRCVYGEYLSDLAGKIFVAADAAGLNVRTVKARAIGFATGNHRLGPYTISMIPAAGGLQELDCDLLVYTGGDLAPLPLNKDTAVNTMVVENPYTNNPHRHSHIEKIRRELIGTEGEAFKLVLAGCGASAMDQLWAARNDPQIMSALKEGRMNIVVVAPGIFPHSGIILEPPEHKDQNSTLRWISKSQQVLIADVVARNLNPDRLATAQDYFSAVEKSLIELDFDRSPHLFMTFLRQLGAVEQTIKDGLVDLENFAQNYHARLEAKLLFTPYEYWRALADIRLQQGALEKVDGRVVQVRQAADGLTLTTDAGGSISCSMIINCTGARNPFISRRKREVLDDLVHSQLGMHNLTGGFSTSLEGQLRLADGTYSSSAYLCTQRCIGLSQSAFGALSTFTGSNRLTAVRVAELAQRMAHAVANAVE